MIFSLTFPWHVTDDQSRLLCSCRLHNLKRILIHTTSIKSACYWKLQTSSLICSLPRYFVTRIIIVLFLYSFSRGFCSIMEQRWNFFRFFFSLQIENIFRYPLLLYASTVLITRSFNFLLARIRNDLYYCQFSKISFNYLLSNKLFLKKSYFLIQF